MLIGPAVAIGENRSFFIGEIEQPSREILPLVAF